MHLAIHSLLFPLFYGCNHKFLNFFKLDKYARTSDDDAEGLEGEMGTCVENKNHQIRMARIRINSREQGNDGGFKGHSGEGWQIFFMILLHFTPAQRTARQNITEFDIKK